MDEQDIEKVVMRVLAKQGMTPTAESTGGHEKDVQAIMKMMNEGKSEELMKLKFVGPSRARKILKGREEGKFGKPMDLMRAGISAEMVKTIFQANCEMSLFD
ncbi:hypothetical protein HK097_001518 [Rhizophlyctis rosea]|uniref:Uncharacterized protein n=1 Tax=Rhizophlyctis rosea TaxID=64517 RepID=A0AAD5XA39_9FUNG|nr:hypothetical protein HK097_001518 [Rhizophlyctis rosea]